MMACGLGAVMGQLVLLCLVVGRILPPPIIAPVPSGFNLGLVIHGGVMGFAVDCYNREFSLAADFLKLSSGRFSALPGSSSALSLFLPFK
jgi:hypothetical protein